MIDFKNITHVVNIFYLGAIAGMEGPLLNILKTKDDKYYFEHFIEEPLANAYLVKIKHPKIEIPTEAIAPLHTIKETSLEEIKNIFNHKNLTKNKWLLLSEFFIPQNETIYMKLNEDTYITDYENQVKYFTENKFKETSYENKYIRKRFEQVVTTNFDILGMFNWAFWNLKSDSDDYILNYILENLK